MQKKTPLQKVKSRCPESWKRNIRKKLVFDGCRRSSPNKVIEERTIGERCKNCKLKCFEKIDEEQREKLFQEYGNLKSKTERVLYIRGFVGTNKRVMGNGGWHYSLFLPNANDFKTQVCCKAIHSIFGITRYMTRRACDDKSQRLKKDPKIRGGHNKAKYKAKIEKHIKSLPRSSAHYARPNCPHRQYIDDDRFKLISHCHADFLKSINKQTVTTITITTATSTITITTTTITNADNTTITTTNTTIAKRKYEKSDGLSVQYYRSIFNTYNLGFGRPNTDTCTTCDTYKAAKKTKTLSFKRHRFNHKFANIQMNEKRKMARVSKNMALFSCDMAAVMYLPQLTGGTYYVGQLSMYTFNMHLHPDDVNLYTWTEDQGNKGTNQLNTIFYNRVMELPATVNILEDIRDNCSGQNKSQFNICMYLTLIDTGRFDTINVMYIPKGTMGFTPDSDHSVFRPRVDEVSHIETPHEVAEIMRKSRTNSTPFQIPRINIYIFS